VDKKPLMVVSICAVVLLVLGSLSNVVGYQTVQSSNQQIINEEVNQKELLFQTILDIANNKEIQRVILKSQMINGKFLESDAKLQTSITKQQLKQMYFIGLILSKFISKTRIQSMVGKYQFDNQEMQQEISAVIEKDATLNAELTQLQNSDCDCENDKTINWSFPILCTLLFPIFFISLIIAIVSQMPFYFIEIIGTIGTLLNCFWLF